MTKTMLSLVAAALFALALPGAASAADGKRTDGVTNKAPQATEFSSRHRYWHRRYGYGVRRYYRPRYAYPRYYGNAYAYAPYGYYRPYYGPRYYGPGFSFGYGW